MTHNLGMSLDDLHVFFQVVSSKGFLRAAQTMGISQSKVSRHVAHLERILGTRLLCRNMHDVILTVAGKKVFKMAQDILECAHQTFYKVQAEQEEVVGEITLSVTLGFGSFWLIPLMGEWMSLYPDVTLHIVNNHLGHADLMMGGADIAISSSRPESRASLHCALLCEYPLHIYASEEYLRTKGTPQTIQDLDEHQLIAWDEPLLGHGHLMNSLLYVGRNAGSPREAYAATVTDSGIATSAAQGLGLALMPQFLSAHFPTLKRVQLRDENKTMNKKYISYSKFPNKSKKHKMLIDFIIKNAQRDFGS